MFASFNARALGLNLDASSTLALAAANGFGGVDLLVRDLVEAGNDPHSLRIQLDDRGLRPGAFPLPMSWRGSMEEFERDLARLPHYAEVAATLGLTRTGTWVMPEAPAGMDCESTRSLHRDRLVRIAQTLDPFGIKLGFEVIGVATSRPGVGVPFVHRLTDLDAELGDLWQAAPNFGVLVDGFHLYAADEPIETALRWGVERIVWVHVADLPPEATGDRSTILDADRGLPGAHPAVPTAALLALLEELGYDGPVTAEPMAGCRTLQGLTPEQVAQTTASSIRSVWPTRRRGLA